MKQQVPFLEITCNNPICQWPGLKQDLHNAVQVLREAEDKWILAEVMAEVDAWVDKKLRKRDYRAWKELHK